MVRPIRVLCFTWNVGNAAPREEELPLWLPAGGSGLDIVAIGTQENAGWDGQDTGGDGNALPPLERADSRDSVESEHAEVLRRASLGHVHTRGIDLKGLERMEQKKLGSRRMSDSSVSAWDSMILRRLGTAWVSIKSAEMMGMKLSVFVRKAAVEPSIGHVMAARSATGAAGGQLGNKGGLAISLSYGRTTMCFVSAHLAAHMNKLLDRNDDFWEVLRETRDKIGPAERADLAHSFDHVFWMGDLNYRIDLGRNTLKGKKDTSTDAAAITQLINAKEWDTLISADQLRLCQEEGTAFVGFEEGPVHFAPTFKVKRQAGLAYQEKRVPSYCDRILWKSMPPLARHVQLKELKSVPAVSTSDHKPVLASFAVEPTPIIPIAPKSSRSQYPLIRLSGVDVRLRGGAIDFMSSACDPYAVFYTNPHGLLGEETPMTAVVLGHKDKDVEGEAAPPQAADRSPRPSARTMHMQRTVSTMRFQAPGELFLYKFWWTDRQLPLLRPRVQSAEELQGVTLVVAMFDHDILTADDSLGTVLIPLKRPVDAIGTPDNYSFEVDTPISWERGVGSFRCTVTVSSGDALKDALQRAQSERAGTQAKVWRGKRGSKCGGLCSVQ